MGFSLIEVLVALFLFATIALQLAQLQATAIAHTKDAWQLTIAVQYAKNISNIVCGLQKSVSSQVVLKQWQRQIKQQLLLGAGRVSDFGSQKQVTIEWLDNQGAEQNVKLLCRNHVAE